MAVSYARYGRSRDRRFSWAFLFSWRRRAELGMLVMVGAIVAAAYLLLVVSRAGRVPPTFDLFLVAVIALGLVAHVATRVFAPHADPVILPVVFFLNGLGYVVIARLDPLHKHALSPYQAAWTAIGVGAYVVTLAVVRQVRDLDRYRYLCALAAVALMVSPLIPGLGFRENGALLWVHFGPYIFQPIEVAKILLVVFLASYLSQNKDMLSHATMRVGRVLAPDPRALVPILLAAGLAVGIMGIENDVGFAIILFVAFVAMVWLATGRAAYLVLAAGAFVLAMWAGEQLFPQVSERIMAWRDPFSHPNTIGYQPIQGLIAIATGGLGGTGFTLGHPEYLPAANTDFIYAVIAEEFGFPGAASVILAFVLVAGAGLRVAVASYSEFSKLLCAGLTILLAVQAFIIMAGIERILPLTGVTLPFVSYGGSSLVANYMLVALLMKASSEVNDQGKIRRLIEASL